MVVGLMGTLAAMLLPVVQKAKSAANATVCLSNLRQMGNAFSMYVAENRGRLMDYMWRMQGNADTAWRGYWPGILSSYKVSGDSILCPAAPLPADYNHADGFGSATDAWTGKYTGYSTVIRFNAVNYRISSYGYNRFLCAGSFDSGGKVSKLASIKCLSYVPAFFDCAWVDALPSNGSPDAPAEAPPDFQAGRLRVDDPEQWRFLLARHGKAINVCFADGSARKVELEDTYTLIWSEQWNRYRLPLGIRAK
jgi:prepilin-type processing-associated H-X9-DG protein